MTYSIFWTDRDERALRKLPPHIQRQVRADVATLADQPRQAHRTGKIRTSAIGEMKLRVGEYRVFYTVSDARREITIMDVRKRDEHTYD